MYSINTKTLLFKVLIPTSLLSLTYLVLGCLFQEIPYLLLFCILGTVILVPVELGMILSASKKEYGTYSLKSALSGQEKMPVWQILLIAMLFFGMAGLFSALIAPLENQVFATIRASVLNKLPAGFDWTNMEYLRSFPSSILIFTYIYYSIFNILIGPITEELFFRGYLTSHYEKQNRFTPILIAVLFSLYHFWLPFNNVFRILIFAPVAYVAYRKKNLYISICFHCLCNLISVIGFIVGV